MAKKEKERKQEIIISIIGTDKRQEVHINDPTRAQFNEIIVSLDAIKIYLLAKLAEEIERNEVIKNGET